MKTEDLDKKIGMPNVDAEWTRFEREVIDGEETKESSLAKRLAWSLGIAASIALLVGVFLFMRNDKNKNLEADTTPMEYRKKPVQEPSDANADEHLFAEVTPPSAVDSPKNDDVIKQTGGEKGANALNKKQDEELQQRIAQLDIVATSADLGPGHTMRLGGNPRDNDSILVVIDGKPVPFSTNQLSSATIEDLERYFETDIESVMVYKDENNKLPYILKYGELAKKGVIDIKTKSDIQLTSDMLGHIAGLDISQQSERQVSDVRIVGTDSVGTLKFLTNYSEGKKLAEHLLIPVDSASESWQEQHKRMAFYDKIRTRLMMPKHVAFGMSCEPSRSNEWSLYYDSVAHALIYTKAEKNIYWATRDAMYKEKKIGKDRYQRVPRKHPKRIKKLKVKSYSMPITNEEAQRLKAMWMEAVGCAEKKKAFALDGTKCEFPLGTMRAKTPNGVNPLVTFTNKLAEAVYSNDVLHKDSLLAESTLKKSLADTKEAVQPVQFNYNSLVIVVNKQQLPDSLSQQIRYRVRQYYHQQGMMIATQKDWSAYGAKYYSGYDKNCPLMELTVVPDTLSDAYVSQHPEMQQALRHVSGIVMDENDSPLADVWVGVRGAGAGAPTDSTGHFSFWMPREEKLLYAECLGYVLQRNIPADANLTIRLRSATVIREVKVIPKGESLNYYYHLKQ